MNTPTMQQWREHAAACIRMAAALHQKMRPADPLALDDIASLVRQVLLENLHTNPELNSQPNLLYGRVFKQAGWRLIAEIDNARLPFAGATNLHRRLNTLRRTQRNLEAALGHPPTPHQLIETHNQQQTRRRKNAARQGALATTTDLAHLNGTQTFNPTIHTQPATNDDDHAWIDLIVETTQHLTKQAAQFIEWWFTETRNTGTRPNPDQVHTEAARLGLNNPDDLLAATLILLADRAGLPRPHYQPTLW